MTRARRPRRWKTWPNDARASTYRIRSYATEPAAVEAATAQAKAERRAIRVWHGVRGTSVVQPDGSRIWKDGPA